MTQTSTAEFSHEVDLTSLSRGEKRVRLTASKEECAKIAARLGVIAVDELNGELTLKATKVEITIRGHMRARLIRECVASLEEMDEEISEDFDVTFLRQADEHAFSSEDASDDASWDGEEVPPEIHEGDHFDLGEFLVQQLALAMDPFPRKPGAVSLAEAYGGGGKVSPFSGLREKLEKRDENQ